MDCRSKSVHSLADISMLSQDMSGASIGTTGTNTSKMSAGNRLRKVGNVIGQVSSPNNEGISLAKVIDGTLC